MNKKGLNKKGISGIFSIILILSVVAITVLAFVFVGNFTGTAEKKAVENNSNNNITSVVKNEENISQPVSKEEIKKVEEVLNNLNIPEMNKNDIKEELISKGYAQVIIKAKNLNEINGILALFSNEEFLLETPVRTSSPTFSGNITLGGLNKIENNPNIEKIYYGGYKVVPTLDRSVSFINAKFVQDNLGYTGNGVTICVVDTGVDYTHPDLGGCFGAGCKVIGGYDYVSDDADPMDENGHGTHVAGIITSIDPTYKGVAPNTKIVALRGVGGTSKDAEDAVQWCIDHKTEFNIKIISMSFGLVDANEKEILSNTYCDASGDTVTEVANTAKTNGIIAIAASGNAGSNTGLGFPACGSNVTSIGAIGRADSISSYTNRNGFLNLLAPGGASSSFDFYNGIISTASNKVDWLSYLMDSCFKVPFGNMVICSGTSMAAPHVAGTVALMLQKDSSLASDKIKFILNKSGVPIYDSATSKYFPSIDAVAAIAFLTTLPLSQSFTNFPLYQGFIKQNQSWQISLDVPQGQNIKQIEVWLVNNQIGDTIDPFYYSSLGQPYDPSPTDLVRRTTIDDPSPGKWNLTVFGYRILSGKTTFSIGSYIVPFVVSGGGSGGDGPGGINFTNLNLNYLSTCDPNQGLKFVYKSEEAQSGEEIINTTNATTQSMDAFLTGLVIPTSTQWITLDLIKGEGGACCGLVGDTSRIDVNFRNTTVAQTMLDADVKLKQDQFGPPSDQFQKDMIQDWINDVKSSPYWSEMQAQGFNTFPNGKRRTWIYPSVAKANGTGCEIYLTNLTLNVSHVWDFIELDLSSYSFRQEIKDDLNTRLQNWEQKYIANHTEKVSNTTIYLVNYDDKYKPLRRAAASLALAQWYKETYRHNATAPFIDIIDSNNITGLNLNVSFDKVYWDQQALQYLYTQTNVPSFTGQMWTWNWYGGVVLSSVAPTITGIIDNSTENLMENASIFEYVNVSDTYYFGGLIKPSSSDLTPITLAFNSLKPRANEKTNISVVVYNKGDREANNFTVYLYDKYTYPNNYTINNYISKIIIYNLPAYNLTIVNSTLNSSNLGEHAIEAILDYENAIKESNEKNNYYQYNITIVDPYPTAEIYSPVNSQEFYAWNGSIDLMGIGIDAEDNIIPDDKLNWTSSKDGYLGSNSTLTVNLSNGDHIIKLTVTDSKGYNTSAQVTISVLPSLSPIAEIFSPAENELFSQGQTVYLSGRAIDPEDGLLQNNSLIWNSSIDGILGYGENVNTTNLSVALHSIDLIATDSSGLIDRKQVNISYDAGYPNITIHSPNNNDEFYYNNNILFNGTAGDKQQGILSSIIQWYSNNNGFLGTGSAVYSILSSGWHMITALVVDEYGLTNSTSVNVFVNEPLAPTVSIITPRNNEEFTDGLNIIFKSSAADLDGTISETSINWTSNLNGYLGYGSNLQINTTALTIGNHQIKVSVSDDSNLVNNATINITIKSALPTATINSPLGGSAFRLGQNITFNATYNDLEDGQSLSLDWRSSIDGYLGNQPSFNKSDLTAGTHKIILNVTDSHGINTTKSVNIMVINPGPTVLGIMSDGSEIKNLTYPIGNLNKTILLKIPKNATVTYAGLKLRGYPL